jgi:pilus assembly protein CpaF
METSELARELSARVMRKLEGSRTITDEQVRDAAQEILAELLGGQYLSVGDRRTLVGGVVNQMKKLGPLQPLLDDPSVTEIMINGPDCVFVERSGRLFRSEVVFESRKQLEDIIQKIVSRVNRTVDTSSPICDARLEDGSRVNVVLSPIALNGPVVTIRKFPEKVLQFSDLVSWGAITQEAADFLHQCVQAKYNIFVSGGTGSGKTTFLNALSEFIPPDERIITIEDSAELQIRTIPNLVRMETRNANTEGKGEITIRDLIRSSLRMRPERIVVGEVRGAEALDMLQAMNTGHDGSLSTGHANSPRDMLSRLETMVLTGVDFPMDAIRQQIAAALDLIVHLGRMSDKSRKTLEIVELCGYDHGEYRLNPLFTFQREGTGPDGKILGRLQRTENPMENLQKFEMSGVKCGINGGV